MWGDAVGVRFFVVLSTFIHHSHLVLWL